MTMEKYDIGDLVEILRGSFMGEKARIIKTIPSGKEVTLKLESGLTTMDVVIAPEYLKKL